MPNSTKMQEWIDWNKVNHPIQPLTNSQARFAEQILNNPNLELMLSQPGDLVTIFQSIQYYLKNKDYEKKLKK
jgi:hypothetical protein